MATITLKGNEIHTDGDLPAVGSQAPDFKLVDAELGDKTLADYAGKKKLLNIVPSLDTPVCATSTKKFNEAAAGRDNVVMLVISADLPFAMGRFCGAEDIDKVVPLSMMRSRNFAKDYGMLITDGPLAGITACRNRSDSAPAPLLVTVSTAIRVSLWRTGLGPSSTSTESVAKASDGSRNTSDRIASTDFQIPDG